MRLTGDLAVLAIVTLLSSHATAFQGSHRDIYNDKREPDLHAHRRNILNTDAQIAEAYDFVIVGGGTAGLALAARLSEDANHTVLCLEAGDTGDAVKSSIDTPAYAYYQSLLGSSYDWAFNTINQAGANNRPISWPRGKVLGGSSAINGMYMVRPSQQEIDAWAALVPGGSENWSWDSMFEGMKASETFTPASSAVQQAGDIQWNAASRGSSGSVHVSYPGYVPPIVGDWTETLANAGIPTSTDAYGGDGWGAFVATSNINPSNWTRSYSRSAYIDPLPPRSNLAILANATVTRLIFSNGTTLNATAVEYAASSTAARKTVNVNKEVILAGGAIGSPHVLLHSGVGPSDVLQRAGVPMQLELPGVGQHLQDHLSTQVTFKTSAETAASLHASNSLPNGVSEATFLSFINSATAYANLSDLVGLDTYQSFQANIMSSLDSSAASLSPSQDPTVIAGYKTIYNVTANLMLSQVGQVEILLSLTGTPQGAQTVAIQAALQHPLSQGQLYITSSDPFESPIIDPAYFSHSADPTIFREGLKLARKLGSTAPLASSANALVEVSPGSSVQTDDEWDTWIANAIGTEFHPSCSCAMLPKELGGVVDANLRVYGTGNVRVVDASVFPISFAAHMQAPVYGLAERAASMIRAEWNLVKSVQAVNASGTGMAPSAMNTTTPNDNHAQNTSGVARVGISFSCSLLIVAATVFVVL
ncbi:GMC oxidoreductase [Cytidiella melzeri]|nr:GMC oxidoreductase [Cytidiella melzeri]